MKLLKTLKNDNIFTRLATHIGYGLIKLLFLTYRIRVTHDSSIKKPLCTQKGVFHFWHQNIIAGAAFFHTHNFSLHCIVSPSGDGKIVGAITEKLGLKVLYGSSYKNPIKLVRASLNVLETEQQLFLIGDGSRGPAKKLKPGITYLAKKTNLPLYFISCTPQWHITLKKTWDQFQIPLPFSKITIHISQQPCS